LLQRLGAVWCLALAITLAAGLAFSPFIAKVNADSSVEGSFTVAFTISDVSVSDIGYHSATISWKTNSDATSQVFYDIESRASPEDYANSTTEEITPVTEHSVLLTGLSLDTRYHFRVRSATPDTKFIAISEDYTFRTGAPAAPPRYYTTIDLFGETFKWRISSSGRLLEAVDITSEDGKVNIYIPKGTYCLDEDGDRLMEICYKNCGGSS